MKKEKGNDPENEDSIPADAPSFAGTIDSLLKRPESLFELEQERRKPVARNLATAAAVSFAVFGLVLGMFSGGHQLWAVPVKIVGGAAVAATITLPSLYIFACLGGMDISLKKAAALQLVGVTLIGLILLGLGPVSWIFTQSTDSVGFMGFLALLFWVVALWFGIALLMQCAEHSGIENKAYLVGWIAIFVIVTFQMSTSLRPLIGPAEVTFLPTEKRFFIEHWFEGSGVENTSD